MEREVIVVGAGPAGSTAAMVLAQKGHDVLLLDRKAFPRDKICGDAVPAGAVETLYSYGMKDRFQACVERGEFFRADGMRLVAPRGQEVRVPFHKGKHGADSYICPRLYFDNAIYEHAVDSGAEFRVGQVKEPLVEDGKVTGVNVRFNGKTETVRAKMVIAADGVTSSIARKLRSEEDKFEKHHRAIALRAYIEDMEMLPHIVEFFLYKGILPGYAWIFPVGECSANIGLGMRIDKFEQANEKLQDMLDRFLEFPEMKRRLNGGGKLRDIATWQLNFGSKRITRAFDGALLIGDAGGYINPLTGGGIHNAIISAEIAANITANALRTNKLTRPDLLPYEQQCDAAMWESMQRSYQMQRWLMRFPLAIDLLVRFMGGNSQFAKTFLEKL